MGFFVILFLRTVVTLGVFFKLNMPSLNKIFFVQYDLKIGNNTSESYLYKNTDMGYLAGIGVSGKLFQRRISLNMIYRNGITSSSGKKSVNFLKTNYLNLNIGYQFGKIN